MGPNKPLTTGVFFNVDRQTPEIVGKRQMGGLAPRLLGNGNWGVWPKRIVRFWVQKRAIERVLSKTSFGGLRNRDGSGLRPFPLRRMTGRGQTYHRLGGGKSKTVFGEGFILCAFPSPRVSQVPLPLSEIGQFLFAWGYPNDLGGSAVKMLFCQPAPIR